MFGSLNSKIGLKSELMQNSGKMANAKQTCKKKNFFFSVVVIDNRKTNITQQNKTYKSHGRAK